MLENFKLSLITGLSILTTLAIGTFLHINSLFYASIAAVVVSQSCHKKVIQLGVKRLYGTIVGALMGLFFFHYLPHSIYIYSLGIFLVVFICSNFLKAPSNMAGIVFLAISTNLGGMSSSFYAFHRIMDTGIGIISTVFVTVAFKFLDDKFSK
ncbi:MAG: FUSC family protein [Psychrilyobacter sp.]|uniref:FUSC family protein n=1 Tax=Psychrilyobacter sp. TaxID=2586924 RepID=UPI003C770846